MTFLPSAYSALSSFQFEDSGESEEATTGRNLMSSALSSMEESIALFGAQTATITEIRELALEHVANWDGEGAEPVSMTATDRAEAFVRALPPGIPMPEVAAETDGAVSLDWNPSRTRLVTLSIGEGDRLAVAWILGTDRGHAVARFNGERVPPLILDRILEATGHAAFRVA